MIGWLTERFGSVFGTKPVLETLDPAAVKEDRINMTEAEMDAASRTASYEAAFKAAMRADYAVLKVRFDCFRETGMLDAAIDSVMNGRNKGLRELLLDTDLLKRIDAEGELGYLVAAVKEDGVWEDAFQTFMHSFGDRVADSIAHDLSTEWRHWLHAAMPKLAKNLLACEGDEATECLVLLGAALPEAAIRSRKLVEVVRADPGAAERAKARLAAHTPNKADRAAAKVDAFMQMAREATVFADDLPVVKLHGAAAAASHPVSEPDGEWSVVVDALDETEHEAAYEAAVDADYAVLKERFDRFRETGTLDTAIAFVIIDGQHRGLRKLLLDTELLERIDGAGLLDCLVAAVKEDVVWEDAFRNFMRSFGDRVADSIAHDLSTELLHCLYAPMQRLAKNLLACEGDEVTECLVLLGAAFPEVAIRSRRMVEAVRADPGAAERAKARLAAAAPTADDRAGAKVDAFMQMAREARVFAFDLPTVKLLSEDEEEKAFMAAVGADYVALKEKFDYFEDTDTLDFAIDSVVMDGRNRGLDELLLDTELLKRIDETRSLDFLTCALKGAGEWEDAFPILLRVFGDRVADTVAHDVPAEFERQAGAI